MDSYKKIRLVGRGAHGTVYLCNQKSDDKLVIIKEIPVDQMSVDERQISLNEAKVLKMLDHPNIVAYYENFLEDKTIIIVMEYVQGGTLFDHLQQRNGKLLTEEEVLFYFGQMVYTLQHVHGKNILHRDLKPQNILLNENKTILKIGDFGISKVLSSKSKAYTVVGTPYYISPELCEGKPYNQKSDIWALGCVLYELMTLKKPFDGSTLPALVMKIMKGEYDPVSETYSSSLQNLLSSMLHLESSQRPTAAQIMCHPLMIRVIFNLYLEIGSVPCIKESNTPRLNCSLSSCSTPGFSKLCSSGTSSLLCDKTVIPKNPKALNMWYFESKSANVTVLPPHLKNLVKLISLGSEYKIGLSEDGYLLTWNAVPHNVLGVSGPNVQSQKQTYSVSILDESNAINIVSVVCGEGFSICLSDNGVVFSFGKSSSGCLGLASEKDIFQPQIVETLFSRAIVSIACSARHVLALSEENEVFSWGHGEYGCLGLGDTEFQVFPKRVSIKEGIVPERIFCGVDSSFIVSKNLNLFVAGSNRHNKLALDSEESQPIDEIRVFTSIISEPLFSMKILSVAAGKSHTVFLTETEQIFTVGSNRFGQLGWGKLGLGYSMPQQVEKLNCFKVSQVACGNFFTLITTKDNHLYCWGRCPRSLMDKQESVVFDIEEPTFFKNKCVMSFSCHQDNCIIVAKDR